MTGQTDNIKSKSGSSISNTDGKYSMSYRGIENVYNNLWQIVDAINIDNTNSSIYINRNSKTYVSDKLDGDYTKIGYSKLNSDGLITKMGFDSTNSFVNLPVSLDGTGTTKYGDYYWQNSIAEDKIVLFRGAYYDSTNGEILCLHFSSDQTLTGYFVGTRLVKKAI